MKSIIQSPMTGNEMLLRSEPRMLTVHGLEVEITYWFYRDTDGKQYTETETDDMNFTQIREQLWLRHGVHTRS
ncbi:MAG: hypothetical protein IPJ87_13055 [Flavobacteriales bacterium]|nr:hypothetical protein [Flavobacteriales bacterium]MBK8949572.1 hypothetical protein [Flavobacteriales bacterium]MBK9698818.1 hypothetical protein [Flavobacteriales bacterium]